MSEITIDPVVSTPRDSVRSALERFSDPGVERPPGFGFVVHQVTYAPSQRAGQTPRWAWCKVTEGDAGYGDIAFTAARDGRTPAPMESGVEWSLGPVVTRVWC